MLLTKRGYQINKKLLTNEQLKEIQDDLLVTPKLNPPYDFDNQPINLLHQTINNIFIPRYYGINKFGPIKESFNGKSINIEFKGSLNDKQKVIMDQIMKNFKTGGIITLPCGYGKTVIGLFIAAKLKMKTIILVHKETLKDQWIERIKQFVSGVKIGEIQSNRFIDGDIIVGMIQTLVSRDFNINDIGLLIVDECHHIASRVFSKCLYKIGANYTIGLSATPDRKDGLTSIIHWYLGPQLIKIENRKCLETMVYQINYFSNDSLFDVINRYFKGKQTIDTIKMTTNLTLIEDRNNTIRDIIIKLLNNEERNILVLSGRIDHINKLKSIVDDKIKELKLNIETKKYIGDCSKEERNDAENNGRVLFASYSIASEGLDIPRLNTIILTTPQKDVKQSVGRIMRKIHNKYCNPLIIDFNDQVPPFNNYGKSKFKFYSQSQYHFRSFDVEDNNIDLEIFNQEFIINECDKDDNIKCNNSNITCKDKIHKDNINSSYGFIEE